MLLSAYIIGERIKETTSKMSSFEGKNRQIGSRRIDF